MQEVKVGYKKDRFGNDVTARLIWQAETSRSTARPVAIIYHGGGLMVGSADIIPKPQIEYLCKAGFAVVIPNYRLAPQVTGKQSYQDCEDAYDWVSSTGQEYLQTTHGVSIDIQAIVAMGHSTGGTLALHIASTKSVQAVAAFYPTLYISDSTTSIHKSTPIPPFGTMPDYTPTADEQATITPADIEVAEAALAKPGAVPAPRNRWQMHILKHGEWIATVCPEGDLAALDPLAKLGSHWPPTVIVQPEEDHVPGSGLEMAQRAEGDMRAAGAKEVELVRVPGETHMFDLPPMVGTTDLGPKWKAVKTALDFLIERAVN